MTATLTRPVCLTKIEDLTHFTDLCDQNSIEVVIFDLSTGEPSDQNSTDPLLHAVHLPDLAVLVAGSMTVPGAWRAAYALRCQHVVFVPAGSAWLVNKLGL